MDEDARHAFVERRTQSSVGAFPANRFAFQSTIGVAEDAAVSCFWLVCVGGPFFWVAVGLAAVVVGSWSQLLLFVCATLLLAFHPVTWAVGKERNWCVVPGKARRSELRQGPACVGRLAWCERTGPARGGSRCLPSFRLVTGSRDRRGLSPSTATSRTASCGRTTPESCRSPASPGSVRQGLPSLGTAVLGARRQAAALCNSADQATCGARVAPFATASLLPKAPCACPSVAPPAVRLAGPTARCPLPT